MAKLEIHDDLTQLDGFIWNYIRCLIGNSDKIVKKRRAGCAFEEYLTIENPELEFNSSNDLIPKLSIPCVQEQHFYQTRNKGPKFSALSYIKISKYAINNYMDSGYQLCFDVVNKIKAFYESQEQMASLNPFPINLKKGSCERIKDKIFSNHVYDLLIFKGNPDKIIPDKYYYSDLSWDERHNHYLSPGLPFTILPQTITGAAFQIAYPDLEANLYPKILPLSFESDDIAFNDFEVHKYILNIFENLTWLPNEDNVVSQYLDASLMRFLQAKEIPILASIALNSLNRPIKDHELEFINKTCWQLACLYTEHLNAITTLAFDICADFVADLRENRIIGLCNHCQRLMRYRKGKKYCSLKSEGRDCGKEHRNKAHYIRPSG